LSKRISFVPGALTPEDKGGNRQKEKRGKEEGGYIEEKRGKKGSGGMRTPVSKSPFIAFWHC
jgi:hypothetical protein